jgi:hypothetical protein
LQLFYAADITRSIIITYAYLLPRRRKNEQTSVHIRLSRIFIIRYYCHIAIVALATYAIGYIRAAITLLAYYCYWLLLLTIRFTGIKRRNAYFIKT